MSKNHWRPTCADDCGWNGVWQSGQRVPAQVEKFQAVSGRDIPGARKGLAGLVAPVGFLKRVLVEGHLFLSRQRFGGRHRFWSRLGLRRSWRSGFRGLRIIRRHGNILTYFCREGTWMFITLAGTSTLLLRSPLRCALYQPAGLEVSVSVVAQHRLFEGKVRRACAVQRIHLSGPPGRQRKTGLRAL